MELTSQSLIQFGKVLPAIRFQDIKTERFLDFFKSHKLEIKSLHTSGHADIQTIKDFVKDLNPKTIIPVHTETPEKYNELFGDLVTLLDDKMIFKV